MALDALLSPKDHSFAMSCVQSYLRAPITVHLKSWGRQQAVGTLCYTFVYIFSRTIQWGATNVQELAFNPLFNVQR